ncbi:MAG: hypothetical protein ACOC04_06210 [Halothece sp.]
MFRTILGTVTLIALLSPIPAIAQNNTFPPMEQTQSPIIDTSDWNAWVDLMPGPNGNELYVTGMVTLPNPGYNVSLVKASPCVMEEDEVLRLELQVEDKEGFFPAVITNTEVRYDDENYTGNYDQVVIQLPDGSAISRDIQKVY